MGYERDTATVPICPGTIGAITWLARNGRKPAIKHGLVIRWLEMAAVQLQAEKESMWQIRRSTFSIVAILPFLPVINIADPQFFPSIAASRAPV
jgi:hypothetical protein